MQICAAAAKSQQYGTNAEAEDSGAPRGAAFEQPRHDAAAMDVTPLEKLVLARLVAKMREMTPEDARAKVVKVTVPLTDEEEMRVRVEHADVIDGCGGSYK